MLKYLSRIFYTFLSPDNLQGLLLPSVCNTKLSQSKLAISKHIFRCFGEGSIWQIN